MAHTAGNGLTRKTAELNSDRVSGGITPAASAKPVTGAGSRSMQQSDPSGPQHREALHGLGTGSPLQQQRGGAAGTEPTAKKAMISRMWSSRCTRRHPTAALPGMQSRTRLAKRGLAP